MLVSVLMKRDRIDDGLLLHFYDSSTTKVGFLLSCVGVQGSVRFSYFFRQNRCDVRQANEL